MKKFNPTKLLFGFLGIATFASLAGTISGTLAWYAYSARATLSYTGTSIEKTAQLQIGVCSPVAIDYASSDKIAKDESISDSTHHYYFAPVGSGLTSMVLNKYLEANGFATNYLIPVTSGSYVRGDSFSLNRAPNVDTNILDNSDPAPNNYFAYFQFVFRITKSLTSITTEYVDDQELWLTDSEAHASYANNGNVFKAIRIFVDRPSTYENDFIFNPTAASAGQTKVGGLLDIGGDGYYDYSDSGKEILFGEFNSDPGVSATGYSGADEIDDINGSGATELDSFTSKHKQGIKYYSDLSSCGIKTASYESLSSIAPNTSNGKLENYDENHPTSICRTDVNDNHLARVNMAIWLEGWDFSVVDKEQNHMFDLGLTFEINKVDA